MPKFKVGDIIRFIPIDNNRVTARVLEVLSDTYLIGIIHSTYSHVQPGVMIRQAIDIIDRCHELYVEPKLAVSDCTCSSRDLLHKGCNCGYAKSLGNQWGLAALMVKS